MSYITNYNSQNFGLFQNSTDAGNANDVGQHFNTADGREVTLVLAGAVNLAAGVLTQSSAYVANHQNLTTVSYTAVSTQTNLPASAVVTLGGTAATANQYQGGFAIVNAGTGIGQTLRIQANTAGTTTANITVTFEDAPSVALDTTSKICLVANPFSSIIIAPTTSTGMVTGVTLYPITAANYGFVVTKGIVSCLSDASVATTGLGIMRSVTTAGTITVSAATGADVGRSFVTTVSAEARPIYIQI